MLDGSGWLTPCPGRFNPGSDAVPTVQEAGWAPEQVRAGGENLAYSGIPSPDRPARSESLYRLSYHGPHIALYVCICVYVYIYIFIYLFIKYMYIKGDSKRWTQLKSKRRLNTRHTVGCSIPSSLLALRVDLRGLRSKLS